MNIAVILVLEWQLSCAVYHRHSHEALLFHYANHVSECSVQCVSITRSPETTKGGGNSQHGTNSCYSIDSPSCTLV